MELRYVRIPIPFPSSVSTIHPFYTCSYSFPSSNNIAKMFLPYTLYIVYTHIIPDTPCYLWNIDTNFDLLLQWEYSSLASILIIIIIDGTLPRS